jgi:hypothetical protein
VFYYKKRPKHQIKTCCKLNLIEAEQVASLSSHPTYHMLKKNQHLKLTFLLRILSKLLAAWVCFHSSVLIKHKDINYVAKLFPNNTSKWLIKKAKGSSFLLDHTWCA